MCDPAPLDLSDAVHPVDGTDPPQPPALLGAGPAAAESTVGTPPFVMRRLSLAEWDAYIAGYAFTWKLPSRLVLHHTLTPTLESWRGLATMRAMQTYYRGLGWTSAPHVYAAPDGIWLATPLRSIGIHAGTGNGSLAQGWYSIGVEMVGDYDKGLPAGATWAHTRAVLRGLRARVGRPFESILSFHRDYSTKSCPGDRVSRAWVLAQLADAPAPSPALSPDLPILGPASGTAEAAIVYLAARATHYEPGAVAEIVTAYRRIGGEAGVDWFMALAQVAHETGALTSWWSARPRRNGAGLGVTGETRPGGTRPGQDWAYDGQVWRRGLSFDRWDPDATSAHLGRLLAYALPAGQGTPAQRRLIDYALALRPLPASYRGTARTWRDLGGRWAVPGDRYADGIVRHARAMRGGA